MHAAGQVSSHQRQPLCSSERLQQRPAGRGACPAAAERAIPACCTPAAAPGSGSATSAFCPCLPCAPPTSATPPAGSAAAAAAAAPSAAPCSAPASAAAWAAAAGAISRRSWPPPASGPPATPTGPPVPASGGLPGDAGHPGSKPDLVACLLFPGLLLCHSHPAGICCEVISEPVLLLLGIGRNHACHCRCKVLQSSIKHALLCMPRLYVSDNLTCLRCCIAGASQAAAAAAVRSAPIGACFSATPQLPPQRFRRVWAACRRLPGTTSPALPAGCSSLPPCLLPAWPGESPCNKPCNVLTWPSPGGPALMQPSRRASVQYHMGLPTQAAAVAGFKPLLNSPKHMPCLQGVMCAQDSPNQSRPPSYPLPQVCTQLPCLIMLTFGALVQGACSGPPPCQLSDIICTIWAVVVPCQLSPACDGAATAAAVSSPAAPRF